MIIEKINFWDVFTKLFSNLPPIHKNNFRKVLFHFAKNKFHKITWKLNYLTRMLIEWTLLNEFEAPIKIGDFKCKAIHKLRQKQFNILSDEYWKLLIYNNPSFATTNFAEVCLDIAFDFKFRDLLILMAIISQKQTLATVNSLKVVEIILSKIWKFYLAPAPLPNSGWLVRQNNFFFSLTL